MLSRCALRQPRASRDRTIKGFSDSVGIQGFERLDIAAIQGYHDSAANGVKRAFAGGVSLLRRHPVAGSGRNRSRPRGSGKSASSKDEVLGENRTLVL